MKQITSIAVFILTIAVSCSNMVETSPIGIDQEIMNSISPMALIHLIIKDPEFLALNSRQQLHVLIAIYNILESHNKLLIN
jgi:hypothetical protein